MTKSTNQQTERFQMRVSPEFLQAVDAWRREQIDLPSRAEAIRRMVQIALKLSVNIDSSKDNQPR